MKKFHLFLLPLMVLASCQVEEPGEVDKETSEPEKRPVLRVNYIASNDEVYSRTEWKYDGKNSIETYFRNGKEIDRHETYFNDNVRTVLYYSHGDLLLKHIYESDKTIVYRYSKGSCIEKNIEYFNSKGEFYRSEKYDANSQLTEYTFRTWKGESLTWKGDDCVDSTYNKDGVLTDITIYQWVDDYTQEQSSFSRDNDFTSPLAVVTNRYADIEHNQHLGYSLVQSSRTEELTFSFGEGFTIEEWIIDGELFYNRKTVTIDESDLRQRTDTYYLHDGVYVLSDYTITDYAYF